MVKLFIDEIPVKVKEGTTVLRAAKLAGINIPTLCYLKDINEVGACRICLVEVEGEERLAAACNTPVFEGMCVHTDTERVRIARKTNLELILSEHDYSCESCRRNKNCRLQGLAEEMGVLKARFEHRTVKSSWNGSEILLKNEARCIKCLRCASVCDKMQGLGVWELRGSGAHAKIIANGGAGLSMACSLCGQCITHCPTDSLSARDDTEKVFDAISNPDKIVVAQIAPAVRTSWGEEFDLLPKAATEKRMVAAMHALGADYVFDTDFSADLTVMEEGTELVERLKKPGIYKFPLFTSCCPGWVRFAKIEYPELVSFLSSAKSPQQMFGAIAKSYFAEKIGVSPEKIFCVSIMPCVAKKYECDVSEINDAAKKDVDAVLTTREFVRMLKAKNVVPEMLEERDFDSPLGESSGAGAIFGTTGGVMEAALRTAYFALIGENPEPDAFNAVRGKQGWREAEFTISGKTIKTATASGLGEAKRLIEAIKSGRAHYDFVEIMACPGGCVGGGGQPIKDGCEFAEKRGKLLYEIDKKRTIRFSHENESIAALYAEYLGKPLSEKSRRLLHTDRENWKL